VEIKINREERGPLRCIKSQILQNFQDCGEQIVLEKLMAVHLVKYFPSSCGT